MSGGCGTYEHGAQGRGPGWHISGTLNMNPRGAGRGLRHERMDEEEGAGPQAGCPTSGGLAEEGASKALAGTAIVVSGRPRASISGKDGQLPCVMLVTGQVG